MRKIDISSSTNAQFKVYKSLLTSKGIKENQQFFLMGEKLVQEFLKNPDPRFEIEGVICFEQIDFDPKLRLACLSKDLFKELDVIGTNYPMLALSFADFEEKMITDLPHGLELICPLGDPRNLGALIRSAAGFGVEEVILTSEATHPYLPQAVKASSGSSLKMNFSVLKNKLSEIPMVGDNYALELHGTDISQVKWPKNLRLWVGEEGPGLSLTHEQKRTMRFIHVPTKNIESLNATVSTTLALWEYRKHMNSINT
jgi:RNA methyltransferase, TrmH family